MVDQVSAPQGFTTVNYTRKDGEHVSATKNNGIVTLVGDKNGTRQMSMEEFKQELLTNCADIKLERTPQKDTVEISKTPETKPDTAAPAKDAAPAKEPVPAPAPELAKTEPAPQDEVGKKLDVAA